MVGSLVLGLAGCVQNTKPLDLLRSPERLVEARVLDFDLDWVRERAAEGVTIRDVTLSSLPAAPPSRLRFHLDVPAGAHLTLWCGIPEKFQERPAVEFVVRAARDGRERPLGSLLLDPRSNPAHGSWTPLDIDLASEAGSAVDIILETRGIDAGRERRAYWGTPTLAVPAARAPLVLLYLVDTLRFDHTTPYGYARDTTPELARFARDAVVFENAISHSSWTKPAVASLLTSTLPVQHQVVQLRDALADSNLTLAEMLRARGYATGAAVANWVIYAGQVNFRQGFDHFAGIYGAKHRPSNNVAATPVVDEALRFLHGQRGRPTFLYAHTLDPHVPYTPPPPFDMMFEPHPTPGHPGNNPHTDYHEPLDRDRLMAQYDGEIAFGDREFGRLIAELKSLDAYDDALIVFVSDHGEEFLDHGGFGHSVTVFDEMVRVPLIVKFPGNRKAGQRVARQVQLVDVLPTVLESCGLPVPVPPVIAGRPLQQLIEGKGEDRAAVSEISHKGHVAHGIRTLTDKYIRRFNPEADELYFDLRQDPGEQHSQLASATAPVAERVRLLKAGMEQVMARSPFRHHLRALGGGNFVLRLHTGGWLEQIETSGFGAGDRQTPQASGRVLDLVLSPRPGQPRGVSFVVRPQGARVWIEGTRDGRPIAPADVFLGEAGEHPEELPLHLPEIEHENERRENLLAPPTLARSGLQAWLAPLPGRKLLEMDEGSREQLRGLGYLGP